MQAPDSIHQHDLQSALPFVAHIPELDVSSCGRITEQALKNLKAAVRLFLQEAEKWALWGRFLEEAGYSKTRQKLAGPQFVSVQRLSLPLPLTHAKV